MAANGVAQFGPRSDFPISAFPPWVERYIAALSHVLQVDPAVIALSVLGATAIAVQGKAELAVRGGWVEPLSFWTLCALRSGNRKTPSLLRPLAPLRAFEREENVARTKYRERLQEAAASLSDRTPQRARRERIYEQAEPPVLELFGSDVTPEAIAIALAEQNESYALVTDEPTTLASILGGLYADGRANTGIFMAGYSGSPYRRRRVKSQGALIERPALSLLLIGQPAVFDEMTSRENLIELGFVGRLLVSRPHDRLGEREVHSDSVPEAVESEYRKQMLQILQSPRLDPFPSVLETEIDAEPPEWPKAAGRRFELELSAMACQLHMETETQVEPLLADRGILGSLSDFGAKLSGMMARAAALLHVLHRPDDWWREPVGRGTMADGIEIGRYALGQVLSFWGEDAQATREVSLADYALERIRTLANGSALVTWRAISRALVQGNGRGRIRSASDLQSVVDLLVDRGDLVPDRTATTGGKQWALPSKH